MQKFYPYIIFVAIIALFYGNTLLNGFVYDDTWLIENSQIIKDLRNLPKVFTGCISAILLGECDKSGVYYRPIQNLQLMLTFQISQKPWIFHFMSLLILFFVSVSIFILLKRLVKNPAIAFIGTVLFLIHPIISENINMVSALTEQYMAIFFVLSFIFYIKYSDSNKTKYLYISSVFYLLSLFAKETAMPLFLAFFAYEFLFKKRKMLRAMLFFVTPILIYLLARYLILGSVIHNLVGYHDFDQQTKILTAIFTFPLYLSKLIFPLFLNAQPDPIIVNTIDFNFLLGLAGWLIFFILVYVAIKKRLKLMALGLVIIFLSLLPVIIFIDRIGRFIFDEGRLFLANIGFTLIVVEVVSMIYARHSGEPSSHPLSLRERARVRGTTLQRAFLSLLAVYLGISWFIVFNRNKDWHDKFSFNKSIAKYAKKNFGVHFNLGVNYLHINELELAAESFRKSLEINPFFWQASYNLGNTYLKLGEEDLAKKEYEKVLQLNPDFVPARENLELLIRHSREPELADSSFWQVRQPTDASRISNDDGDSGVVPLSGTPQNDAEAVVKKSNDFTNYSFNQISFDYPKSWNLEKNREKVVISDGSDFTVEISLDNKKNTMSANEYIEYQTQTHGTLITQGQAKIPNMDWAFVRVWDPSTPSASSEQKLQFFLFKKDLVIEIIAYPSDSSSREEFDNILGSIKVNQK